MRTLLTLLLLFSCILFISVQTSAQTVKDITVAEAHSLISKGNITILDVRTEAEWKQGHLKGAVRIDVMDKQFKDKVAKLDKSKPVVVYCAVGGRSSYASDDMVKLGFPKVFNMEGGIKAWSKANYPVQK